MACLGVNRAENGVVAIVLCSEDDPSLYCASPFTANAEISGGKSVDQAGQERSHDKLTRWNAVLDVAARLVKKIGTLKQL